MTLKEQFKKEVIAAPVMDEVIDYWVSELEQTADEFAIGFAEWVECSKTYYTPMNELLEIYKKEKGL
jgi:hypothetical protein